MWQVELTAVDAGGNRVVITGKKITVVTSVNNGLRVTKTFTSDRAPPCLHDAVNQIIKHIRHADKN